MKKFLLSTVILCLAGIVCAAEYSSYQEAVKAGEAALKAKNYEAMHSAFVQAKKFANSDFTKWNATFFEVKALREMKKFDDSIKQLDEYLAGENPENLKAAMNFVKGLVLNSKNEKAQGTELIEKALSCNELFQYMKDQSYSILMNYYYSNKNFEKCAECAKKAIADQKSLKEVHDTARFYYVQSLFDQQNFDECEKYLKEYTPLALSNGNKARMAYIYGCLLKNSEEFEEATKQFELAIKYEPNGWRSINAKKFIKAMQDK